jgi:nucleotide-binding universal stress UspA family protein
VATSTGTQPIALRPKAQIAHVAAAVDSLPEGNDAAVLATAITRAVDGDLVLVAIEPELSLVIPGADWRRMRRETESMLARTRECFAPGARLAVDSDLSSARGITRVLGREHRQLAVCGSSKDGPEGRVSIGLTSRQLIGQVPCALAIAPRGLSTRGRLDFTRIGVGFDGEPEARAALSTAAAIAAGCGAELIIRGVIDDRIPKLTWPNLWIKPFMESWNATMDANVAALRRAAERAAAGLGTPARVEIDRAIPGESLRELSLTTDLLVIGSRRWGAIARILLGGTGEALVHGAHCSLLVVPRPGDDG